jgi:Gpi18-like mannosyltransferase
VIPFKFKKIRPFLQSSWRLLVLVVVLLALFIWAYQPQRRVALDVTAPGNEKFLDHFYPAENGARWTESRSGVWLPGLGGGNLPWHVGLTLSAPRPGRFATPAHVAMRVNGATVGEFDARNQEEEYEWEVRPWQLGLNGDVLLEIESSTFQPSSDGPELGVRISRVWLTRANGIAYPSTRGLLVTLALIGCCAAVLRMSANAGLLPIQPMRIAEFINPFRSYWAWIVVATWILVVLALSWNGVQAPWWLQAIAFALLFATAVSWAIARLVSGSLLREQILALVIIFVIGALIRIPLDLSSGYEGNIASYGKEGDIATYIALAWKTVGHGIHSAYLQVNGTPPSDNPPVLLYPFWFLGWLYEQLISPLFGRTRLGDPDMLRFMLRTPGFAADLLAGALIFRVVRARCSFNAAILAAAAYVFNPALIFDSAYWGQTAGIHSLFMLLSIIALDRHRYDWAGVALAAAILTKPQAIAIAPLVLLLAIKERGTLRFASGGVVASLLIVAPFIAAGNVASVVQEYEQTTRFHPFVAPNAHNFWWFVTGGHGWQSDMSSVGPLTFRNAGFLLFGAAALLSLILVWSDRESLFLAAAYQSLAFFMLDTQIHENHLLAMFAPLAIAAALDRQLWWFYGAFATTSVANMTLHDPKLFAWLGYPPSEIYGGLALAVPRWVNSAAQTVLFIAFTVLFVRRLLEQHLSSAPIDSD